MKKGNFAHSIYESLIFLNCGENRVDIPDLFVQINWLGLLRQISRIYKIQMTVCHILGTLSKITFLADESSFTSKANVHKANVFYFDDTQFASSQPVSQSQD